MSRRGPAWVVIGRIEGAYGVRGWVRVRSFTQPPDNIETYGPWRLRLAEGEQDVERLEMRPHAKGFVARLAGVDDRDAAAALAGVEIVVPRSSLEPPAEGHFYWSDLIGMAVKTVAGRELGRVETMMETGANDVMVVIGDRRRLIPFVMDHTIRAVDLDAAEIVVEWDPDF